MVVSKFLYFNFYSLTSEHSFLPIFLFPYFFIEVKIEIKSYSGDSHLDRSMMEGLLPLVYKAIKRNRTRRQYECLSSGGSAAAIPLGYNISMVEIHPQIRQNEVPHHELSRNHSERVGHRRYKSVGDFGNGFQQSPIRTGAAASPPSSSKQQLVRFRSHRMFSCITGVWIWRCEYANTHTHTFLLNFIL